MMTLNTPYLSVSGIVLGVTLTGDHAMAIDGQHIFKGDSHSRTY